MLHRRQEWYKLVDRVPVPVPDLLAWAEWMERHRRECIVAQDQVGPLFVSTVFLGLDHNWFDGPPILFESGIFDPIVFELRGRAAQGLDELEMRRSSTWEEADADHLKLLEVATRWLASADRAILAAASTSAGGQTT